MYGTYKNWKINILKKTYEKTYFDKKMVLEPQKL